MILSERIPHLSGDDNLWDSAVDTPRKRDMCKYSYFSTEDLRDINFSGGDTPSREVKGDIILLLLEIWDCFRSDPLSLFVVTGSESVRLAELTTELSSLISALVDGRRCLNCKVLVLMYPFFSDQVDFCPQVLPQTICSLPGSRLTLSQWVVREKGQRRQLQAMCP